MGCMPPLSHSAPRFRFCVTRRPGGQAEAAFLTRLVPRGSIGQDYYRLAHAANDLG